LGASRVFFAIAKLSCKHTCVDDADIGRKNSKNKRIIFSRVNFLSHQYNVIVEERNNLHALG